MKEITTLSSKQNEQDWRNVLNPSQLYKLTYSLKILEGTVGKPVTFKSALTMETYLGFANPTKEAQENKHIPVADDDWKDKFVKTGGVTNLLSLLLTIDEKDASSGNKACFALLLKVINNFVTSRDQQQAKAHQLRYRSQQSIAL